MEETIDPLNLQETIQMLQALVDAGHSHIRFQSGEALTEMYLSIPTPSEMAENSEACIEGFWV